MKIFNRLLMILLKEVYVKIGSFDRQYSTRYALTTISSWVECASTAQILFLILVLSKPGTLPGPESPVQKREEKHTFQVRTTALRTLIRA